MKRRERLGENLIRKGLITKEQLDVARREKIISRELLGQVLVRFGFITQSDKITAIAETDPESLIVEGNLDIDIPREVLLSTRTIVLGDTGDKSTSSSKELFVATLGENEAVIRELKKYVGDTRNIKLVPIEYGTIIKKLKELEHANTQNINVVTEDDINRIINHLIWRAMDENASDIHIEPDERTIHIRNRVDGILYVSEILPVELATKLTSRLKEMAGKDVSEKMQPQDGSFSLARDSAMQIKSKGGCIDFRLATLPSAYGEKLTIRILDKEKVLLDIRDLGITAINDWVSLTKLTEGIVLVCGPTGGGKTTTLYSTIRHLKPLNKAIYMIEDPIEYRIPWVTQVQVNRRAGLDYARFIKTVLRHDPDIVIVGEIRDKETAEHAVYLAETGHLVYATMHTNDVAGTIQRLQDNGVHVSQVTDILRGIMVQRLVRKLCSQCNGAGASIGCKRCKSGYNGRTLVSEFVRLDSHADVMSLHNKSLQYHKFEDDARLKLAAGVTDCMEIERVLGFRVQGDWCSKCQVVACSHRDSGRIAVAAN